MFYAHWFSSAKELEDGFAHAAKRYVERYGERPRALVLHPDTAPDLDGDGVSVKRFGWVPRHAIYFVVNGGADGKR